MLFDNLKKCLQQKPNLTYDEACVDILNTLNDTITLFYQYDECYKCDFQNLTTLGPNKTISVVTKTSSPIQVEYTFNSNTKCHYQQLLYEHYRYGLNVTDKCSPIYIKEPADNAYLPILMAFVILFSFGTIWYMIKCIYKNSGRVRQLLTWSTEMEEDLIGSSAGTPLVFERSPTAIAKHANRLKSIDTFRGLCIALMIFVNYGGGQYWFFKHSVWNGLTIADLVFPWFLWLMGFSLTVSIQNKIRTLVPKRLMVFQVIRRSFILILLGIIINSNKNLSTVAELRIPGVLQRIGLVYLVVGILEVIFTKRLDIEMTSWAQDIISVWPQWLIMSSLVVIHTCVTLLVEVPGCGKGYLGPGGLEEGGDFYNCTGGVAGYIDRRVFGSHLYRDRSLEKVYENVVRFDPEGILGTLTSILTVYFGVQAGRTLITYQNIKAKVIRWTVWGIVIIPSWAQDITVAWRQWSIVSALITIHTFVIFLADVPGCGRGYLGPGGLEDGRKHFNCTGGVTGYIDRQVFGRHMYTDKACQGVYENVTHNDPEGIFGTFTAILTAYLGVQAGRTLNTYQDVKAKMIRWTIWGIIIGLLGGILCSFSRNEGPIPLNKKIWSLSFVLITAGMAFVILAFLYLFVDILKKWGGRPLFYPGMNPIVLYVGHELMTRTFPFGWKPVDRTHGTFLFMNLWGTFLWFVVSIWLYKHDLFLKI